MPLVIGTQVFAAFHQLRRVAPSALGLFCFLVILWLALGNGAGEFARSGSVCPSFTLMPSKSCCSCHPGKQNTCVNCACAKKGLACTKCYLSQAGKCLNPFGTGHVEVKAVSCPFEGCSSTGRISSLRAHVNDAHVRAGFVVADSWLEANDSRLCSCKVLITSNSNRCSDCRARPIDAVLPSKARYLPALHLNHMVQLSLGTTTEALDSRLPEPSTSAGSGSLLAGSPRKVCSLLADGSCGDTGCDGPVPVHYVSCRSSDFAHSGGSSSSMSIIII